MSLITNYRPRTWDELIGNDALVMSLVPILQNGTSHAFLLTGNTGCGKTTIARLSAQELKAQEVTEIDAATNNGIDDMRHLIELTNYRPMHGIARVIIIDEAQAITSQAWKALLKSVEEPPPWLYWFFCTTEIGKVPANIKSRCSIYQVSTLRADDLVTRLLRPVCVSEGKDPSDKILYLCADRAEGSPRRALVNLAQVIDFQDYKLALETLVREEIEESPVIGLTRLLVKQASWNEVRHALKQLTDENPETVRRIIESYVIKVILDDNVGTITKSLTPLLEYVSTPINSNSLGPIIAIASKWVLGK
jgi:DNA polymerase III gamma/tau subunit